MSDGSGEATHGPPDSYCGPAPVWRKACVTLLESTDEYILCPQPVAYHDSFVQESGCSHKRSFILIVYIRAVTFPQMKTVGQSHTCQARGLTGFGATLPAQRCCGTDRGAAARLYRLGQTKHFESRHRSRKPPRSCVKWSCCVSAPWSAEN